MKALRFLHAARFQMPAPGWLPLWLMLAFVAPPGRALEPAPPFDLTGAVVVIPRHPSLQEQKAIQMLVEEVEKRTQVRWPSQSAWPTGGRGAVIAIGRVEQLRGLPGVPGAVAGAAAHPEGYELSRGESAGAPVLWVRGADDRGVLFGVGRLLRSLELDRGHAALPSNPLPIATSPDKPIRGHQLGYRPKCNSYDGWTVALWEQYIRDLAVFGCNSIELIPPRSDDDPESPHFPLPQMRMMVEMSRICADYGLDVSVWYPAMDEDYSRPETVAFALREWADVLRQLPRLDVVFVPGGDPGHTPPRHLLPLLEKQAASLRRFHPKVRMWVSPQSFDGEGLAEFYRLVEAQPSWLGGIVYGPQVRVPIAELRARVPARYPIRDYPDITHSRHCQYPVPEWDLAYALTEGRESINPRPTQMASIYRATTLRHAAGFISYSEGCNDDVNKAVWSALGWDPDRPVIEILREYSRYFIGEKYTEGFAQGLLALERNWRGPLAANAGVETTLAQFQEMERKATPAQLLNWRFQQALFRAYYDAYTRSRLLYETTLESQALERLRRADRTGTSLALREAGTILDRAQTEWVTPDRRDRIFQLAEALFQSIRMQLSVPRYQAIGVDRGASLDTVDYPLNNRRWLHEQFARIQGLQEETNRLAEINGILNWTNPGPGGFYDDLGNIARQPHLVRGQPFAADPASLFSSKTGFEEGDVVDEGDPAPEGALRLSWIDHA
ncbi:MAG TPA: hypothetical protein DCM86_13095, partial [Verrucomicrobiales bacterium]|nr:hypothetical protein [Verrucomicrobiales bacterium]